MKTKKFKRVVEHDRFYLILSIVPLFFIFLFFINSVSSNNFIMMHISLLFFIPLYLSLHDYIESRKVYWEEIK